MYGILILLSCNYRVFYWLCELCMNDDAVIPRLVMINNYAARGRSHMSADIICLSKDPFFTQTLQPNDPEFHYIPHPMTPPPLFSKFPRKTQNFSCTLRAFRKFCQFSGVRMANFLFRFNFDKIYIEWPPIWEVYTQKAIFSDTTMIPFF